MEAEILSSLSSAKVTGDSAIQHAKSTAIQYAQSELDNIRYHATNPEYECGVVEAECSILTNEIQSELLKQYNRGICCFSSTEDNPLLWSHYGDQHHGLCVGYDLNREPKPRLYKVIYCINRIIHTSTITKAIIEKNHQYQEMLDRDVLLRKALPWSYEEEWRLLGKRGIQNSILALKDITFGLRCPVSVRYAVINALKSRSGGVVFYEIFQVKGSFDLKKRLIETEDFHSLPKTAQSGKEIFGLV
jgi:hypothetical protein